MINKMLSIIIIGALQIAAGVVANWNFNAFTDSTFTDASGNGNNGVLHGAYQVVPGVTGTAIQFAGAGYAIVPHNNIVNVGTGNFTFSAWIKLSTQDLLSTIPNPILAKSDAIGWGCIFGYKNKSIFLQLGRGCRWVMTTPPLIQDTAWHYIVAIRKQSRISIYIDNLPTQSTPYNDCGTSVSDFPESFDSPDDWYIGRSAENPMYYYNGKIDELSFSNALPDIIQLKEFLITKNLRPLLSWNKYKSVSSYRLIVSSSMQFSDTLISALVNDTFYQTTASLPRDTTCWKVLEPGNASSSSFPSQFIITSDTIKLDHMADTYNLQPVFIWRKSVAFDSVQIVISDSTNFSHILFQNTVFDTFFIPSAKLPIRRIYWKVGDPSLPDSWAYSNFLIRTEHVSLNAFSTTTEIRPMLRWKDCVQFDSYRVLVSNSSSFSDTICKAITSDTFFTVNIDLPVGRMFYWKVGNSVSDSNWSPLSSFGVIASKLILVPSSYATLQAAVDHAVANDTIICSAINDAALVTITNKTLFIRKADNVSSTITIANGLKLSHSTLEIKNVTIAGTNGLGGADAPPGYTQCLTPGNGTDGTNAFAIDSSTVRIRNCIINGGAGGRCGLSYRTISDVAPCSWGTPGKGAIGLISNYSIVDLLNSTVSGGAGGNCRITGGTSGIACRIVNHSELDTLVCVIGSIFVDSTSTIKTSTTGIVWNPNKFTRDKLPPLAKKCHIEIYNLQGRMIVSLKESLPQDIYRNTMQHRTGVFLAKVQDGSSKRSQFQILYK